MAAGLDDGDDLTESHEINVTPFIDVMLVLLIIFMVAAPLATVDVNIDLPAARGVASQRPDQPVWLSISPDLALHLGDEAVSRDGLVPALETLTKGDREARIFLRADRMVPYGEMMEVLNSLRSAGWTKVALVGLDAASSGGTSAGTGAAP
ncbi:MAG: TonB system transport protein ExbD [Paracoccus sp. (in: a-proteobacteria)]|uniref:TonB system transport protein ExbD n=1 Tax=Paracoccus sp. TaxID=267 RepID=UPI0026DF15CB|nr:TonB system transport protein ExbD [Paracoccus sp. (in: a-proteobacteria)]MDO5620547.1 TonB system transport protein ExbD [Paracoccus sp. (in: a-proteobacteria)]